MKLTKFDIIYVGIQLVLFVAFLFDVDIFQWEIPYPLRIGALLLVVIGILVGALGALQLNVNLSPFPSPKNNSKLITNGLYKHIRHPIYTGILLVTFGYALYAQSLFKLIIFVALSLLFYLKSSYEEKQLNLVFKDYANYKLGTGRFLPKIFEKPLN